MSDSFENTCIRLKNIIDNLNSNREYEFHFNSASGTDVTSRFGDLENIQYHNDESWQLHVLIRRERYGNTNNLSDESIESTIKKSETIASFLEPDEYQGLPSENLVNQLTLTARQTF